MCDNPLAHLLFLTCPLFLVLWVLHVSNLFIEVEHLFRKVHTVGALNKYLLKEQGKRWAQTHKTYLQSIPEHLPMLSYH